MLSSALLLSIFGTICVVSAQSAEDLLASSTCYLTCAEFDPTKAAPLCNVSSTDSDATDTCFCTNKDIRGQFDACVEKTCAPLKDSVEKIFTTNCGIIDKKDISDVFDCIAPCGEQLVPQLNATCPDPDTQDECACKSQPILDSLKGCLGTTCSKLSDAAFTYFNLLCAFGLNDFNNTSGIGDIPGLDGAGSLSYTLPGSPSSASKPSTGTTTSGAAPSSTGNSPGGAGGSNTAATLARRGYAGTLFLVAAIVAVTL